MQVCTPRQRRAAGFTIAELAVASTIAAIVIVAAGQFVASVGADSARQHVEQKAADNARAALSVFGRDVLQTGFGIPQAVPVQSALDMNVVQMGWIWNHIIQDADNGNANPLFPLPNARTSDVIKLGGVGMDLVSTGSRVNVVAADFVGGVNGPLQLVRWDQAGFAYGGNRTADLDPQPGDRLIILSQAQGWRGNAPFVVGAATTEVTPGLLDVFTTAPMPQAQESDYVYTVRAHGGPAAPMAEPWLLQSTTWFVSDTGMLTRRYHPDPENEPGDFVDIPVLRNVEDFQVAYLVWPCGGAGPIWIDDLSGHFLGGAYVPGVANAKTFMSIRERIMAIRATVLLRLETAGVHETLFTSRGQDTLMVENNLAAGLQREGFSYVLVSEVYDPINLRVKTGTNNQVAYPRIVSPALDARTGGGTGLCDPRAGAL